MYRQFLFFRQWAAVRTKAAELGVRIIGDIPIFVAHDSADVWARQDEFRLDASVGVPPDAIAELWPPGTELYPEAAPLMELFE